MSSLPSPSTSSSRTHPAQMGRGRVISGSKDCGPKSPEPAKVATKGLGEYAVLWRVLIVIEPYFVPGGVTTLSRLELASLTSARMPPGKKTILPARLVEKSAPEIVIRLPAAATRGSTETTFGGGT